MVSGVVLVYDEYDENTLKRVSQSPFKRYNKMLRVLRKQRHRYRKEATKGQLQDRVDIDQETFQKTDGWWAGVAESDDDERIPSRFCKEIQMQT